MKRKTLLGFALSLTLGIAIGRLLPQLFVAETPDAFWYRVEWSPTSGYRLAGGGTGIYKVDDVLKVGIGTPTLDLPQSICPNQSLS